MKTLKIVLLFILNLVIDLVVLSRYQINGIVPSITIALLVVLSIYSERENIVYYAIFQGIFQDVAFASVLGSHALLYYLISYYTFNNDKHKNYNFFYGLICSIIAVIVSVPLQNIIKFISKKISLSDIFMGLDFSLLTEIAVTIIFYLIVYSIFYALRKIRVRNFI